MKGKHNEKKLYFLVFCTLFLVSCNLDNSSSSNNKTDSMYPSLTVSESSFNTPSSDNSNDYGIYPQTIIVNEKRYDMIVDLNSSLNYELDKLIGHIIHEDYLTIYNELYPNLIPVIDNYMHNSYTNNMIEIYSVKEMDMTQYLALKIITEGNIVQTELFKAN